MEQKAFEMALAFQRGEEKGFEYFFNMLRKPLLRYSYNFLKSVPDAEDIVADCFVKLWNQDKSRFTHHNVIARWMFIAVRNASITAINIKNREAKAKSDWGSSYEETTPSVLNDIIRREVLSQIYEASNNLPTACQVIFNKLFLDEQGYVSIAKELSLSPSTIKNQRARAYKLISEIVSKADEPRFPTTPEIVFVPPPRKKMNLIQMIVAGFPPKQIASELNIHINHVYNTRCRMKKALS